MSLFKRLVKKIGVLTSIVLITTLLVSTIVYAAWEFDFPIAIQDTSSSARTHYPVMLNFGGDSLIAAGKINANALDTNIQIGTTDIEFMMHSDNVTAVIPSLPAGGVVTVNFYTGYTPNQTEFPIIIGESGSVSRADHAELELSDGFEVEIKGWVDTSVSGVNQRLIYKLDAFRIYVVAADTIRVSILQDASGDVEDLGLSTAAVVPSGEYTITASADGVNLMLVVINDAGGVANVSVGLGANSVPDNGNAWAFMENNTLPYMEYITIEATDW